MGRTLVAGLGSPHGNDQLGWRLVDRIAGSVEPAVEVAAVAGPLDLLEGIAGIERLIIVDACRAGEEPGTISRLVWPDSRIHCRRQASSHGVSLPEALRLAENLGRLPPSVVIFGVEIDGSWPGTKLSPAVEASLGELARRVVEETGSRPAHCVNSMAG